LPPAPEAIVVFIIVDVVVVDDGVVVFIRFVARDNMLERIPQLSGIPRKK